MLTSRSSEIGNNLSKLGFSWDDIEKFASTLRFSQQPSVDAFIEERPEFLDIGKAAIAVSLIGCENLKNLLERDLENSAGKWYHYLLNLLGNREEFRSSNLSIITFNYDRSLEYFLFHTLTARYGLEQEDAASTVSSLKLVHVYGQLGEPGFINADGRDYTIVFENEDLQKAISGIKIIHESNDASPELETAQEFIGKANTVLFVGFGYHRKNVERLFAKRNFFGAKLAGTFYGRQDGEVERDLEVLRAATGAGVNFTPIDIRYENALEFLRKTNYLR